MKKQEYIKPTIEIVEINGEAILQASGVNVNVTSDPITDDSGFGAKQNFTDFDVWE